MKILDSYYFWFEKFKKVFKKASGENFLFDPFEIVQFDDKIPFDKEIDDFLFKKIYYYLYFLKNRFSFLVTYKKEFLALLEKEIEEINLLSEKVYSLKEDKVSFLLENYKIISGNTKPLEFSYFFKNGFNSSDGFINPNFKKIKKVDFEKEEFYGKVILKFKNPIFLSNLTLLFTKEVRSKIFISYKKNKGSFVAYTSPQIELSKAKSLSLGFEECSELIISSTDPFNNFLSDIFCYGGNDSSEFASGYGLINFSSDENLSKLFIASEPDFSFFKVKKTVFDIYQSNNSFLDFNNDIFTKLEINSNNIVSFDPEKDIIVFAFSTEKISLKEFKFFGGV